MSRPKKHDGVVYKRQGTKVYWIRYPDKNGERHFESLTGQPLRLPVEQRFGRYGRFVPRAHRPTGRIAGFASLKGSPSLFSRCCFSHPDVKCTAK